MVANKSFKNVAKFGHLGMALTNQNFIQEAKTSDYHAVWNLLYFCWLSKDIKIKIYSR
jgi:hypothetical protein